MKVSVIIPIYNVEPFVKDCLDSVRGQTLEDLEIICIHDAGQDRSFEIVKSIAAKDRRIRLLENDRNLGLAATRNRGLLQARGKYVYFLDSDDMVRQDALELLYQSAEQEQLEVQVFGSSFLYETDELEVRFQSNSATFKQEYPEVMAGQDLFVQWMEVWDWISSQPRYFYNRNFLESRQIRYVEGMLHEDEVFAFDVLMYAKRVKVTNDTFFIRRFRPGSIMTSTPTIQNVEGCVKILEHVSAMQKLYQDMPGLNHAVKHYMYKIFCDAKRKYQTAANVIQAETGGALIQKVSGTMRENPTEMAIYHMIEAFGMEEM